MQRPVMHPTIFEEAEPNDRPRERYWIVKWIARTIVRILLTDPLGGKRPEFKIEDGSPFRRFVRGFLYRLALVPVLLVLMITAFVYAATHPPVSAPRLDPSAMGIYFEKVKYVSEDGTRLEGWLVPVVDAQMVLMEKDSAIARKDPAVVLVHDYAGTREQMITLIRPLHEQGYVVMVAGLRGAGDGSGKGETFGLNESLDVSAAVKILRAKTYVAPDRIAIVGMGSGATAALIAAQHDRAVTAVVLDHPIRSPEEMTHQIGPAQHWLKWMEPLCKWTFELAYRVDAEDLDYQRISRDSENRPMLTLDVGGRPSGTFSRRTLERVSKFLNDNNSTRAGAVVKVSGT
jgi:alpha-beta hydrolase superfamily lysophospholipase